MANKRSQQPKRIRPKTHRVMCKADTPVVVKDVRLGVSAAVGRVLNQDELVDALVRIGARHLDEVAQFIRAQEGPETPPPAPGGGGDHA